MHVKVVPVEIDPVSKKVSVESIRAKINSRTMAVVASAPQYPHGVFDPIEEIAGLAKSMDVPMHVDCCLGGFLVPFANVSTYYFRLFKLVYLFLLYDDFIMMLVFGIIISLQ